MKLSPAQSLSQDEIQWLTQRLAAVMAGAGFDGEDCITTLCELDVWRDAHRGQLPRDLEHFLTKRSYGKALALLSSLATSEAEN